MSGGSIAWEHRMHCERCKSTLTWPTLCSSPADNLLLDIQEWIQAHNGHGATVTAHAFQRATEQ